MTTMKKNYWMAGAMICALSLAATGCSNEELNESITGKRFTVTASTPAGGADTRISYDETNPASVSLAWEANDAIGVWKAGETTVNEFTTATAGGSADFISTGGVTFTDGDQLYAVYPKPTVVTASNEVTLDLSTAQTGALDKNKQYMYASAAAASNTANFKFHHAVSVLKLTFDFSGITGTAPTSLNSVILSANGLHNKATLTMGATPAVAGTDAGSITANRTYSDLTKPVCLYVFAENLTDINVMVGDGSTFYTGTLTDKNLEAGKVYTATVAMTPLRFQNEGLDGDGSIDHPYTIKTPEQLKLLSSRIAGNANSAWNTKSYKLIDDINISGMNPWIPIGITDKFFSGTFDGDNHTVSGLNINSTANNQGLFGLTSYCTIRNLNVSGTVKGADIVGGIVGRGNVIRMENCSFSGSVEGTGAAGGCLGTGGVNSNFVFACRNFADITLNSDMFVPRLGGITSEISGAVIGCYNTGKLTIVASSMPPLLGGCFGFANMNSTIYGYYNTGVFSVSSSDANAGQIIGKANKTTCDYFAYLTGSATAPNPVGNIAAGTIGTNSKSAADAAGLNTQDVCDMLNAGIKTWNTANTGKECNYHYVVGTGSNTTPVLVAGAPQ